MQPPAEDAQIPARNHAPESPASALPDFFHPAVRYWFEAVFTAPTRPQLKGWPAIARGDSTLIFAPTGTGKTLAAFLWCIQRLMFTPRSAAPGCRVLYISPIKALAVDVERNLRAPMVGIANAARQMAAEFHEPTVAVRSGDTPPAERARFARHPAEILITTPESLYLLLTSNAREALKSVETVILDEIHALVPTKRGSHLSLSLERLEHLCGRPLQRIGLSATQRPLEEVAAFLGGAERTSAATQAAPLPTALAEVQNEGSAEAAISYRPVTIVDAGERKPLDLRIEVPVEDMARLGEIEPLPSGPASQGPKRTSIWSAIHPKLLEMVRTHNSTIIFVNSRRLAERISGAINELAGETLVRAHHGSVAVAQRKEIEDRLKLGSLKGIVATSSLELGIDMGAVDLVIQIEAPPSVASGMQRIGRASHQVGAVSKGIIIPKYRADLLAAAAAARAMLEGNVEATRYPRNPLDVLAQQIVAMVAMDEWNTDDLFRTIRRAAPYASLERSLFEGVLDMLAGRYPSEEFGELRPRIVWDRVAHTLAARQGARSTAVTNGGTIPDRGLYGVFIAGAEKASRVGELDEEMVFENRPGDTIILGASTWRIEEITHDRVLVSPAPGEPGKMPFWHGDTAGRPAEFGGRIGATLRELAALPAAAAHARLTSEHGLDGNAAENLMRYIREQEQATSALPTDRGVVLERCRDELGDWRVCVLTPFGSRVHAPWCLAVTARLRAEFGMEVESMWTDDGFVIRLPDNADHPPAEMFFPPAGELRELVIRQLGATSLFAAKFREAAGRALLLPRRRPGGRTPLWQQRKRSADLLSVASKYESFPILLEVYRECLRDVFDLPAATSILRRLQSGEISVTEVQSKRPSPFASALLFSYIANFIYEGDAPLAERRAQALAIDQAQLQELLGESDLRELLDGSAIDEVEAQLQSLEADYQARNMDAVHDLLLRVGDLSEDELRLRVVAPEVADAAQKLVSTRRVLNVKIAGTRRFIAVEDAARYRDALGVPLPPGIAESLLQPVAQPLLELVRRYARTHGPFTAQEVVRRYAAPAAEVGSVLRTLAASGRILEGEFRPHGAGKEFCDADVLRSIRQRSLARLRKEIEPVEQKTYARMLARWQGVAVPRAGMDALLDAIEVLQGAPLLASELEREILPSRVNGYRPDQLDTLMASGEVVWVGIERIGERDGRIALYLAQNLPMLLPPRPAPTLSEKAQQLLDSMQRSGAQFFAALHAATGGGFPGETTNALWELVWAGLITNDTFHPLRALARGDEKPERAHEHKTGVPGLLRNRGASRRSSAQGRWSLLTARLPQPTASNPTAQGVSATELSANLAQQFLLRHGVVTRESVAAEDALGGFSSVYPSLKTMEESGWVRRGHFIGGLGAAQFALPAAVDMLRSMRLLPEKPEALVLAATDPANPYGATLPWPRNDDATPHGMSRTAGASVVLVDGQLAAFFRRRSPEMRVFLPEDEPERSRVAQALAQRLAAFAIQRQSKRGGLLIAQVNGQPVREHFVFRFLEDAGFVASPMGMHMRRFARIDVLGSDGSTPEAESDIDAADEQDAPHSREIA